MNTPVTSRDPSRRVVITGMGAVTNLGLNAQDTWNAMREGRSGISTIEEEMFDRYPEPWDVKIGGQAKGFSPEPVLDRREARRLDRCTQLGVVASEEAVRDSGLDFNTGQMERRGIVIGSGIGGIRTIEEGLNTMRDRGWSRMSPFTVHSLLVNGVSGNVSFRYFLQGPSSALATVCASSGHAIGDAMGYIQRGLADVMLAGGAEAAVSPLCIGAFSTMKALSKRNDEPT
ncbi:MAG: beta-ketoacyl-[acyl-carrier-protein] synthase family protein, partial [Phycisphaerales bacterium JB059]